MSGHHQFKTVDYLLFVATVAVSVTIGLFYALSGGKQMTTNEFLLAGRQMSFLPVAISLFVSFESSIMMLGLPAEAYMHGIQLAIGLVAGLTSVLLSAWIVAPLMYPLGITSTYEYLELRFKSRFVRQLGSFIGIMSDLWYTGIVLFGPAVALQAVTGFPLWVSIGGLALVAVVYTTIGGLKAVIWTDVFQTLVMISGIFAILMKGTLDVGGAKAVWNLAEEGGRLNFFNFDLDPRTRHTFWNLSISLFMRGFSVAFKQSSVQRICSTTSLKSAKRVLIFMAPASFLTASLALYEGIVSYAYYAEKKCDPFASKQLSNSNQIIPFIVMDIFRGLPGMPGLFIAALFSASLSTISSCLSSQSALLWTDFVHPLVGDIPDWKATMIAKISVVFFGSLACGIAWLISLIGGTLQEISSIIMSSFTGPLLGIFFLGCFSSRANAKGVIIGGTASLLITFWITFGMSFSSGTKRTSFLPPALTDMCPLEDPGFGLNATDVWWMTNQTTTTALPGNRVDNVTSLADDHGPRGISTLYTISYTWIPCIATLTALLVGYTSSVLTGGNKPGEVDPRYLLSVSDSLFVFVPKPIKRVFNSVCLRLRIKAMGKKSPNFEKPNQDESLEVKLRDQHTGYMDKNQRGISSSNPPLLMDGRENVQLQI